MQPLAWPTVHAFDTPTRKDGFLATNSLLATLVVIARAYAVALDIPIAFPTTLNILAHPGLEWREFVESWMPQITPLLERHTLVVLHGGATKAAAADIESRFTEAALGSVQVADFRNFAHGRHHWLAVNADSSSVLALSSPEDALVAKKTLALVPKTIPRLCLEIDETVPGILSSVCQSIYLAQIAGRKKGIDPGRPHVPMFGRKLYHLSAKPNFIRDAVINQRTKASIERKTGLSIRTLAARGDLDAWAKHHREFIEKLGDCEFEAIVFDYDGTLCNPVRRFEGLSKEIAEQLVRLLKAGIYVGIATGRGKSVRDELRKHIRAAAHRKRVVIAYHNGAEIGTLDNVTMPPEGLPLCNALKGVLEQLHSAPQVTKHVEITAKGEQITLQLSRCAEFGSVFEVVSRAARDVGAPGVAVVRSTHSIDVLAPGITKLRLLKHLQKAYNLGVKESRLLTIGDRGEWPGNDADLLNHTPSLSVDQVSRDPRTCWNLSAPGLRYDVCCLDYLLKLVPAKSRVRFDIEELGK